MVKAVQASRLYSNAAWVIKISTAGGAYAHLTVGDLQDYVTNNMRGILKSEKEWNVLQR